MPHFLTSDGLSIYYEDEGTGLPILCLSGLTRNSRDFDHVAPQILRNHRMIRMDYRGRGKSDYAPDPQSYTVPREALDALELLDHLNVAQAALLGTSRGGLIAMALAATAKSRLLGVALNDIGPVLEPEGLALIMSYLGVPPDAPNLDSLSIARKAAMEPQFPNVPLSRWRQEVEHTHLEGPEGVKLNYDAGLRQAILTASEGDTPDLWPYFEAIAPLPCAVIHGENSDLLSRSTVAEMQRCMPALRTTHVTDRGHIPFLDEPQAQEILAAWLADLEAA